ncbi:MAG TPA: APC family permease [Candidatus Polarisedimenticolaceae bacterium]
MLTVGGEAPTPVLDRASEAAPRRSWRTWLFGRPLPNAAAEHESVNKTVGLAVFSSDALSSTAYATQEILIILAAAGSAALAFSFPIAIAIAGLMAIVTVSYRQTIYAYPDGGGAYTVSRDNLGEFPAQIASAALLTDYILTVAVSMSSGVAQLASAFPPLQEHKVLVAVIFVAAVTVINLRGVRESGAIFAIPTYAFVFAMTTTVGLGLWRAFSGTLASVENPPPLQFHGEHTAITAFLILHAFSSGTAALTGIEAISNGITAFRKPRSHNAAITLLWMSTILGTLFLGITYLARSIGAVPSETETVISQLARTVLGGSGLPYLFAIATTTLILIMAANTAFNGFPRLSALQAADGYLPKQLTYRGSRLVFSRGIIVLALTASLLIWAFDASVTALIPLYAIGVFLSFTLSQVGMTRRLWKSGRLAPGETRAERGSTLEHDPGWRLKLAINAFGATCTATVTIVFAVTKFRDGAWIVIVLIPLLIGVFYAIHRHYRDLAGRLALDPFGSPPRVARHRVIVPVSSVHRGTVAALRYARALSDDITAVHVTSDAESLERFRGDWSRWGDGVRLVVLDSPYRLLIEPLLDYVRTVTACMRPNEVLTIVVPQFVPRRRWHNLLHAQTAAFLRLALMFRRGIVITSVPYHVREDRERDRGSA